jgi:hypothetical protein
MLIKNSDGKQPGCGTNPDDFNIKQFCPTPNACVKFQDSMNLSTTKN